MNIYPICDNDMLYVMCYLAGETPTERYSDICGLHTVYAFEAGYFGIFHAFTVELFINDKGHISLMFMQPNGLIFYYMDYHMGSKHYADGEFIGRKNFFMSEYEVA